MAKILRKIYKKVKTDRYYIRKEVFTNLAGRKRNLRDQFLLDVNEQLHKRGLTLIDLRKLRDQKDYIALIKTERIFKDWKYLSKKSITNLNILSTHESNLQNYIPKREDLHRQRPNR